MNNNDINNQTDDLETQNTDADSTVTDDLKDLIEQLPENLSRLGAPHLREFSQRLRPLH